MNNSVLAQLAALPEQDHARAETALARPLRPRAAALQQAVPGEAARLTAIQELAYGGLSARAEAKLKELIEEEDRRVKGKLPVRKGDRPIAGTRLIREWQGVEHCATVLDDGFEYQGRRYKSLSAIARAITGTRWNGPAFFGFGTSERASEGARPQSPLRHLHPRLDRRAPRHGVQLASTPSARRRSPTSQSQKHEGWILVGDRYDDGGFSGGTHGAPGAAAAAARCRERRHRRDRRLQGGPAEPLAHRLRKNCRSIRKEQSLVRQHNAAIQHDDLDGPADAQHPALASPSSSAR